MRASLNLFLRLCVMIRYGGISCRGLKCLWWDIKDYGLFILIKDQFYWSQYKVGWNILFEKR